MDFLKRNHIYFVGLALLALASIYLNWNYPPQFDEAHAWNIAKYLSPTQIFEITKTEGHPFLWYYLLMPFAKTDFMYPYSLYALNLILFLLAFFIFYRYAPFPNYLKYLITLSAPFLQLYANFARNYTLTILFLFIVLSLYKERHKHQILYLICIILLANTHILGLFMALPLGLFFLSETIKIAQNKNLTPLLITINFGLLELVLLLLQFYGYDSTTATATPTFNSLYSGLNKAFYPLNAPLFCLLILSALYLQIKQKSYVSALFLMITGGLQLFLYTCVYQGGIQQHHFFYISLIASYWLSLETNAHKTQKLYLTPLALISFALIFNPYSSYKTKDLQNYQNNLKESALSLNQLYRHSPTEIILFEQFDANIIRPYLNNNIILLNQQMTNFSDFKSFQGFLIWFQKAIQAKDIADYIRKHPQTPIFRTCGKKNYYNTNLIFTLKHHLNKTYCLYEIKVN